VQKKNPLGLLRGFGLMIVVGIESLLFYALVDELNIWVLNPSPVI
jgi:hypothetical protein